MKSVFILLMSGLCLAVFAQSENYPPPSQNQSYYNPQNQSYNNNVKAEKNNKIPKPFAYKRFRVDLNLLGNFSFYRNESFGLNVSIEPKFFINRHFSVGFLAGTGFHFNGLKGKKQVVNVTKSKLIKGVRSTYSLMSLYEVTADYHIFGNAFIRPYVGVGMGVLRARPLSGEATLQDERGQFDFLGRTSRAYNYFVLSPRVGFDIWHIRVNAVYHLPMGGAKTWSVSGASNIFLKDKNANLEEVNLYSARNLFQNFSFQVIFYLWGGKKR